MRLKKMLVVIEKTKFMLMKEESDEPIIKYLSCLKNVNKYCEFEKLRQEEQTIGEELSQLGLI